MGDDFVRNLEGVFRDWCSLLGGVEELALQEGKRARRPAER
jgi:hypothetical protein